MSDNPDLTVKQMKRSDWLFGVFILCSLAAFVWGLVK